MHGQQNIKIPIYILKTDFYLILLLVSAVFFSHHQVGILFLRSEPVMLPDDDRNRQRKHETELHKTEYERGILLCCSERKIDRDKRKSTWLTRITLPRS